MRKLSNFFAIVFAVFALVAIVAVMMGYTWHWGTAIMCGVLAIIFWEENRTPQAPGFSEE